MLVFTVKLRYNVFLGTVTNSTLYQRYVVTKERFSYIIINPNPINQMPVNYSALLYCFLKKLSKAFSNVNATGLRLTLILLLQRSAKPIAVRRMADGYSLKQDSVTRPCQ